MPTTRKQQAEGRSRESHSEVTRRLTFDEPPESPSAVMDVNIRPTTGELPLPAESGITEQTQQEDRRPGGMTTLQAPSIRSGASSIVSRIAQAELQAQERLAMLKKKEFEIEAELVKKRLAVEVLSIREEEEQALPAEPAGNVQARIDEWLHRSIIGQQKGQADVPSTSQYMSDVRQMGREDLERGAVKEDSQRRVPCPPSPRRGGDKDETEARASTPHREKGIDRLADVLEKMTRQRPVPRQAQDLPIFSGAPLDWLAYKAAMRDSTKLFKFKRAENLARLRISLRGEAKEAVSSLLFTATDPDVIMATLEQCFGRPEVIIDRTLDEIRKLRPPGATASEFNSFAIKINNIVCTLSTIDSKGYLKNPMLARDIVDKLSPHIKARWCDYAEANISTDSEMEILARFLMQEADRALRHAYNAPKASTATSNTETKKFKSLYRVPRKVATVYNMDIECLSCNEKHATPSCPKIKAMDVNERWKWARQEGICFRCFNSKHKRTKCSRKACGMNGCRYPHHQLLHRLPSEREENAAGNDNIETVASLNTEDKQILLKICPVQLKGPKGVIQTYALCDEGSSTTIIDEDLADNLGAEGPPAPFAMRSINAHSEITNSRYVSLQILTKEGAHNIRARTMKDLSLNTQKIEKKHVQYPHLRDIAKEICTVKMKPKILIGSDFWELIVTRELREGSWGQPVASLTKLGWVIHGSAPQMRERDGEIVCHIQSVANRVTEINESTEVTQWRWVSTEDNVADDATRLNFDIKTSEDRWFIGSNFLYKPEAEWPHEDGQVINFSNEYVLYVKTTAPCIIDINRFSKYERLLRAMGRIFQFVSNCRQKTRRPLSSEHITQAETWLIRQAQREDFAEEIEALERGSPIPARCPARRLTPFLDAKGVFRASGRASAADAITIAANYPIILSGRHPYTRLLVARAHRLSHHGHNERVVNDLRQQYFIYKIRPTVRAVARSCALCRVRKASAVRPVKGDLPKARMEPYARPFSYCGIDYFGPMIVTIGRRHEKRWGALFTCLTTRAIHIELVASLSTDSAIMAMRRMASRPRVMYSDNATNFKGADQELRSAMKEWEPVLRDYTVIHKLTWRTIVPGAAWQGGAWEGMIQTVKRALKIVLTEKHPKEEILQTLLAEVEYTVNARPLTHVPVTREDPEALTPNHFLLGSSMGLPTLGPCEPADRKMWRAAQGLADEFWKRWVRECLPLLVPRNDAPNKQRKIAVDDLVVVVDRSLPRNLWPRGIVIAVHPGPDGEVRNCTVRTASGVFRRPAGNLAVLPIADEVCGREPSTGRDLLRTDEIS